MTLAAGAKTAAIRQPVYLQNKRRSGSHSGFAGACCGAAAGAALISTLKRGAFILPKERKKKPLQESIFSQVTVQIKRQEVREPDAAAAARKMI